jgi:hypothetical protein
MPVIVLTTIAPPPPPPTGFGGDLYFPGGMNDLDVDGSLRAPEDIISLEATINMIDLNVAASLRAPDDDIDTTTFMRAADDGTVGSLRSAEDIPMLAPNEGNNVTGSPNVGDV